MTQSQPHRQYPPPSSPWVGKMIWDDLLFEHWRVPFELLRPLVPAALELETCDGSAWIAVVPFQMRGVRVRATPPIPGVSAFPELNVRTYVTFGGKPGVWFFSLDAAQPLAVVAARAFFHLSYQHAEMSCERDGDTVVYSSRRREARPGEAEYRGRYAPLPAAVDGPPGSLAYFLTARYCLYAADGDGRLYRGEIDHQPWPLQEATATIEVNTMTRPLGFDLPAETPLRWFCRHLEVHAWAPERLT
jgi:uncharacterized protein YqjF (DUF2071 family)